MKKLLGCILLVCISGCSQNDDGPGTPANPACPVTTAEISECSVTIAPGASPVTVTGTAQFYKRTTTLYLGEFILGAPIPSPLPIKFAEVRVLNSAGLVVQCGVTNSAGALKAVDGTSNLEIPNTAGTYTVEVLSRSNHAMDVSGAPGIKPAFQLWASVKKDTCSNSLHSISANVTTTGIAATIPSPPLIAYAKESETASAVQGGAFNIYNNLVTTYEYLATDTGIVNISCLNPKLHIFWQAGFNPAQYIYPDADPSDSEQVPNISFYLRGYNELYINGGRLGNVTTADTDHFDDAVIIHEISHRIEDACGKMDSPGGKHNGLFRIDPRLAWSEGWGNYMGAHIIKNNLPVINPDSALATDLGSAGWVYYLDTSGYRDGVNVTANEVIRFNLTKPGNNPETIGGGYYFDKVNSAANPGEGHFREVSIARSLFKITNTCASGCTNHSDYFDEVWKSIDKITGMGQVIYPFRSSARFYDRLNANFVNSIGSMPVSIDATLNSDEAQQRNGNPNYTIGGNLTWPSFGIKLVSSMVACNLEMRPKNEDTTVTNALSDQRYSNHFYTIDKATTLNPTGITSITLTAAHQSGTTLTDIDLILYQEGYQFVPDSTMSKTTTSSQFVRSDRSAGLIKTIAALDVLSTAPYLLNVRAFTTGTAIANSERYTYTLTNTNNPGEYLCPSATF